MKKKAVLDTSVVIDGLFSRILEEEEFEEVIIPRAVIDELQAQASRHLDIGFKGLAEVKKIREICEKKNIPFKIYGPVPTPDDIKLAKSGRIDAIIRDVAKEVNGTLYTGDYVLYLVAEAEGVKVEYIVPKKEERPFIFESYFDKETLSVHLKEGVPPYAKKGRPGRFRLVKLSEKPLSKDDLERIISEILRKARTEEKAFIEIKTGGATVIQLGNYRIAIARPPFSDGLEVTIVRPIVKLTLEDYRLSKRLIERLKEKAEGILIAGPPGSGKTTLASSIAEFYMRQGKVVKTLESPRDLQVGPEITQYGPLEGDFEKSSDVLLLVRPDYTIFDEIRKTKDFEVFADMRLAGVGMVGVVHASSPVDAVQRFIGRVELGMIPHIVDTVIFVKDGEIKKVYDLRLTVKVPTGMTEEDLARPVVEVRDFETGELEYEIYTFGEENVIVPIKEKREGTPIEKLAIERIYQAIRRYDPGATVEIKGGNRALIKVARSAIPKIIGRHGSNISQLEEELGIRISIQPRGKRKK